MAKSRRRVLYEIEEKGHKLAVEFLRLKNLPGYSHRVVINGTSKCYLQQGTKPDGAAAQKFAQICGSSLLTPAFLVRARVNFANGRTGTATCRSFTELGGFIDGQVLGRFEGDVGAVLSIELTMVPIGAVEPEGSDAEKR